MKNRLYVIEGLPCSGKSTTSKYVYELLRDRGEDVVFVDEGSGDHPADYEFHSYISEKALGDFSEEEKKAILSNSDAVNGGYILHLSACNGELFQKALQYKIYDFLDWDTERKLMLGKWRDFADSCGHTYVFNCCLIQNPMCETMMRFGFDKEASLQYISEICNIIKELNPVVIYLKNSDIETSVRKAAPKRSDEWLNAVIDYHVNGGYGKSAGLSGFDGYIACLEERQRREVEILKTLPVEYLVLENAHEDWKRAYSKIKNFLF